MSSAGTLEAAKLLCRTGSDAAENKKAIRTLVGTSEALVAPLVEHLLDEYDCADKSEHSPFSPFTMSYELLSLALSLASGKPLPKSLSTRLVETAARAGFVGRFPEITRERFGREPSEQEVLLLIDAYVANLGARSTSTEEKLLQLAAACPMSRDQLYEQRARIDAFVREFDECP